MSEARKLVSLAFMLVLAGGCVCASQHAHVAADCCVFGGCGRGTVGEPLPYFQLALAQELALPFFRKNTTFTAYTEPGQVRPRHTRLAWSRF